MAEHAGRSRSAGATALRADTVREIKTTARRVLVDQGVDGLALRAVAREMGMTAPGALPLLRQPRGPGRARRRRPLRRADRRAWRPPATRPDPATPGRSSCSPCSRAFRALGDHPPRRVRAAVRQRRRRRGPRPTDMHGHGRAPGRRLAGAAVRRRVRRAGRADLPRAGLPGAGRRRARPGAAGAAARRGAPSSRSPLPLGVMQVFLSCWIRLYGMVCMEIFGHLRFALDDAEPMFEAELRSPRRRRSASRTSTGRRRPDARRVRPLPQRDEAHC